ncbi:hypothetical protein KY289_035878 [Solanum tuberosum]|nr:hypothetical protein KY289_035878 [Solanum tuberosum]
MMLNHDVLVANFKQTSILRLDINTNLDCKIEIYYTMLARKNHFALLSSTIWLQNLHARFNVLSIGITDPVIFFGKHSAEHVVLSMSAHHWSFKICFRGLLPNLFAGRNCWFVYVVINGDDGVLHDFNYVAVKSIGAIVSSLFTVCTLQMFYQDDVSFMYNMVFAEGVLKDILYLSSLEFILFVIKRFIEKFPQDERYFLTVVHQAKFPKLLDDMEQVVSNLKSAHFKGNLKQLHYISLLPLVYFVASSTRIVHLNKWVSGQRLKDNVQLPRPNNVSWRGIFGLQDGWYIDLIMFKYLVVVYNDARDGLQLSFPLFCVFTMLSWSVSEHLANFEVVVELDHIRVVNKATFIMTSILRI